MEILSNLMNSLPAWITEPLANLYVKTAAILVLFFILGKLVDVGCCSFLRRLVERTETDVDDRLLDVLHRPISLSIFLGGLAVVVHTIDMSSGLNGFLIGIIQTWALIIWALAILPVSSILIQAMTRHPTRFKAMNQRSYPLFTNIVRSIAFGLVVYEGLKIWHVDPTAWIASAGIIGIAVGFAAKDSLGNLFSGASILADSPYQLGDYINLDSGERGEVSNIGLRSTRIVTRDGVEVTIPNAVIANAKIVNESRGNVRRRIRLQVGVAYGSDIDHVCAALEQVGADHAEFATPMVRFRGFGESSLDFELMGWIQDPGTRGRVKHELYTALYRKLGEEKIEIPFPKRDLYIKQMPKPLA